MPALESRAGKRDRVAILDGRHEPPLLALHTLLNVFLFAYPLNRPAVGEQFTAMTKELEMVELDDCGGVG